MRRSVWSDRRGGHLPVQRRGCCVLRRCSLRSRWLERREWPSVAIAHWDRGCWRGWGGCWSYAYHRLSPAEGFRLQSTTRCTLYTWCAIQRIHGIVIWYHKCVDVIWLHVIWCNSWSILKSSHRINYAFIVTKRRSVKTFQSAFCDTLELIGQDVPI